MKNLKKNLLSLVKKEIKANKTSLCVSEKAFKACQKLKLSEIETAELIALCEEKKSQKIDGAVVGWVFSSVTALMAFLSFVFNGVKDALPAEECINITADAAQTFSVVSSLLFILIAYMCFIRVKETLQGEYFAKLLPGFYFYRDYLASHRGCMKK